MAATSTLLITPMQATLASVRRTLAWADTDPQRLASSRWLGAVCARLIAPLAAEGGADVAEQPALHALLDQLLALDALEGAARHDAVKAALDAVGAWVPP